MVLSMPGALRGITQFVTRVRVAFHPATYSQVVLVSRQLGNVLALLTARREADPGGVH
jgi:hypothetical protein